MSTIARSISMIRSGNAKRTVRLFVMRKLGDVGYAVFAFLIRRHDVQQVIVEQFLDNATPMCGALRQAVDSAVESAINGINIDASEVNGLDRAIEEVFESNLRDIDLSSDVRGFDEAVERVVNGMDTDDIIENVVESITDAMRNATKHNKRGR